MTWDADNPFSIVVVAGLGPRERPHHPRGHLRRDVGADQLLPPVDAGGRRRRATYDAQPQRVLRPDPADQPAHPRHRRRHHAHGEAWEFFQLGKYLERACQTARILDVKYHILLPQVGARRHAGRQRPLGRHPDELLGLRAVPQEAAGRPRSTPATAVADFLIFDPQFPRSVRRCLWECRGGAAAAARATRSGRARPTPSTAIAELLAWLDGRTIARVIRAGLHESLTHVVDTVHDIGEAIHATYFDVEVAPHRKAPFDPGRRRRRRRSANDPDTECWRARVEAAGVP